MVQNVGAARTGENIEVFWTPHSDPDIEYFKVYYDTDGQAPYEGTGILEGDSPISVGNTLSFELNGADSSLSYTVAVTAVDSGGSESEYSSPYTVFALAPPNPVDNLTIRKEGDEYVLDWTAIPGSARYFIEKADSPEGPWIRFAQTYSTSLRRSIDPFLTKQFFRVIAQR